VFILFSRLFNVLTGLGAQLIVIASGEFPQYSIQATTDIFFLMLCLTIFVILLGKRFSVQWRVIFSGALAGAAYVTRYNGLFLLPPFLIGILVLDLFEQRLGKRIILCALFLGFFALTAAPWLVVNWSHRGSPFYNTNYLNIATEFYPELAGGKVNQDG